MDKITLPMWSSRYFSKHNKKNENLELLGTVRIFQNLTQKEILRVYNLVHERNYKKNEFVFEEGHPGSGIFILKEGKILIEKNGTVIEEIGRGNFVGEIFLLNDMERSVSARCSEETKLLVLFREELMEMVRNEPEPGVKIMINLAEILSVKLTETNKILTSRLWESGVNNHGGE